LNSNLLAQAMNKKKPKVAPSQKKASTAQVEEVLTTIGFDSGKENEKVAVPMAVDVKMKTKTTKKQDALQLDSVAIRAANGSRAGVQGPCDGFGCDHMGIMDFLIDGGVGDAGWMRHHLDEKGYLKGNHLCYICQVGTRPREGSDKCKTFFCPGCLVVHMDALEKSKKAKEQESGSMISKHTSGRKRGL
jgi:hypothetical protein